MQGRKEYTEECITYFQLSSRVPKHNFYRRLKETLDLTFIYEATNQLYGHTGNPSIDPIVFFKFMLIGAWKILPPTESWSSIAPYEWTYCIS